MKMGGMDALQKLKTKMEEATPVVQKSGAEGRTPAMLRSETSGKILKYLLSEYGDASSFKRYLKDYLHNKNVEEIKQAIDKGDLSSISAITLDDVYQKIVMVAPLTESGDKNVYGRMAQSAGCEPEEIEAAVKLLSGYRDNVHKRFLGETNPQIDS